MKKTVILLILFFGLYTFGFSENEEEFIISTYDGKNAKITVSKSDFTDNSFRLTFNITWINIKLKPVKDEKSILAVLNDSVKAFPSKSLEITSNNFVSEFSNKTFFVDLFAMPDFEGGKVKLIIPFVYAENEEEAKKGNWQEVLYNYPKEPAVLYYVDGKLIKDLYPPVVKLTHPKPSNDNQNEMPIVDTKSVKLHVSVYDKSGIKEVFINDWKAELEYTGEYTANVNLFTGLNIIKVKAVDNFNNESTTDVELICSYQYDLDLRGGSYYALIVGINDYTDPSIPDLDKPISDAESLKNVLTSLYTFDDKNVVFLKNPTRSNFINQLDKFADILGEDDNLLIFYAGHGYWDDFKEIGYWMPSDAVVGDHSTWIRNSTIKEYIGVFKTRQTLLITDACFSGSIFKTRAVKAEKVVAYQKIYDIPGRKGMTSGTLKEVPDVSVFLNTMIKRLKQNEDKYLPSSTLFNSLRDAVLNNSPNVPQFGTIQGAGDEGGEFIFIKR